MTQVRDAKKPSTTIQSVSRAAQILLAVAASEEPMVPKEIAARFDLTLPTTYHLLATLEMEGLLTKDPARTYSLGPAASIIAEALAGDYSAPEAYMRGLNELAGRTSETVYLSAWRRGNIRVLASIDGAHVMGVSSLKVGYSGDLHARASSKLLLAYARPELREPVIDAMEFIPLTSNTITSRADFETELEAIRLRGVSFDRGEFAEGVECVSAPIRSGENVVACYTVSVPTTRFAKIEDAMIEAVTTVAASVSS